MSCAFGEFILDIGVGDMIRDPDFGIRNGWMAAAGKERLALLCRSRVAPICRPILPIPEISSSIRVDKHHKGMASANRNLGPGEQEGWCLPRPSDILELRDQQHPTRKGGSCRQAASGWNGTSGWTCMPGAARWR
jgi:hypothetical protein